VRPRPHRRRHPWRHQPTSTFSPEPWGIKAIVPLSLLADAQGTRPHVAMPPRPWYRHDGNDRAVRLADVVIAWNILQHFYPYFDVVKMDWTTTGT